MSRRPQSPHGRIRRADIPTPSMEGSCPSSTARGGLANTDYNYERRVVLSQNSGGYRSPHAYYQYGPSGGEYTWSDARPAPPQNPLVAAMANSLRSQGLLSSKERSDDQNNTEGDDKDRNTKTASDAPQLASVACWRLRMCALFLVCGCSMQAVIVGAQLQSVLSQDGTSMLTLYSSISVFATLVFALWSLLSQLLLWSDAAVLKLPQHMILKAQVQDMKSRVDV